MYGNRDLSIERQKTPIPGRLKTSAGAGKQALASAKVGIGVMTSSGNRFHAGDAANGLTIEPPTDRGVIHVVGNGFWTPSVMDTHFQQLKVSVAAFRRNKRAVRMIVDLRKSLVQSPETTERMKIGAAGVTEPGDRMAILVGSSLAKMQMRRTIGDAQHEFFVSADAAAKWVEAY